MIFVDTGIWFAATVAVDPNHSIAATLLREAGEEFVTSDYVVDETLTLMKARGRGTAAIALGDQFFAGDIVRVQHRLFATWVYGELNRFDFLLEGEWLSGGMAGAGARDAIRAAAWRVRSVRSVRE